MVAANVEAAKFVEKAKLPALYRVHENPDTIKIATLREFLAPKGLSLGGGPKPKAGDFAKVLREAKPRRSEEQTSELQSLMRTSYAVLCMNKQNTVYIIKTQNKNRQPIM